MTGSNKKTRVLLISTAESNYPKLKDLLKSLKVGEDEYSEHVQIIPTNSSSKENTVYMTIPWDGIIPSQLKNAGYIRVNG